MPYKDPERKRQWEREHREQRNARRRDLRLNPQPAIPPKAAPDPRPSQETTNGWKTFVGLAVGVGILIVAAFAGGNFSDNIGLQPARVLRPRDPATPGLPWSQGQVKGKPHASHLA